MAPEATEPVTPTPEPGTPATPDPAPATEQVPAQLPDDHPLVKAYNETKRKLKEREDRDKTETERLTSDLEAERSEHAATRAALLRFEVAQAKGIAPENVGLIQGSSREEMEQAADKVLALQTAAAEAAARPRTPAPVPTQGDTPVALGSDPLLEGVKKAVGIA